MEKFLNCKRSYFTKYLLLFITLSLLLIFPSCPNDTDLLNNSDKYFFGYLYDPSDNSILLHDKYLEKDIIELSKSYDSTWIVYSKIVGGGVDLFKMHIGQLKPVRITYTDGLEFNAAIDNNGNTAWAYSNGIDAWSLSKVFFNGIELSLPNALYKDFCFNNDKLYFSKTLADNDIQQLIIVNLLTYEYEGVNAPFVISNMFNANNRLLLEGFDLENYYYSIYSYDSINKEFILQQDKAVFFEGNIISVKNMSKKQVVALMIEKALLKLDPFMSISAGNNYFGRLCWFNNYRMESFFHLYLTDGLSDRYNKKLIKNILNRSVSDLISSYDSDYAGWPTKRYSISKETKLSLMVNNAMVMYPILKIYNHGWIIDEIYDNKIIETAKMIYLSYEKDFHDELEMYIYSRGIEVLYDGVPLPFNMQNSFGLMLIELYRATQDEKYKERVYKLAENFKKEFLYVDNRLLWHYYPQFFYNGWTIADNISSNTPSRKPRTDTLYEDISHAGLNVLFILKFIEMFGEEVFTNYDVECIKNTMVNFNYDRLFSRYIGGSTNNISLRTFPRYGWYLLYSNDYLQFIYGMPAFSNYWDSNGIIPFIGFLNLLQ